ncbi:MAG TPA: outer membrane protein transport protein [Desulfomonilia bacterium]
MNNITCHRTPNFIVYLRNALLPLLLVLFFQTDAVADTASFLGLSSRASSMAGAMTAISDDYTAAYYNPSGLNFVLKKDQWLQLGIGAMYVMPDFKISDSTGKTAKDDENIKAITAGLVMDLGRLESHMKGFTLGISCFVPTQAILDIDIPETARDYFFPVYNDVAKGLGAYAGISKNIGEKISIGIGSEILLRLADTDTHITLKVDSNKIIDNITDIEKLIDELQIDISDSANVKAAVNRELILNAAFYAGLTYKPVDWLSLGFSFRDKISADSSGYQYLYILPVDKNGNVNKTLADRIPVIKVDLEHNSFFSPREYTLGLGLKGSRITASFDLTYSEWSDYKGPHQETPDPGFKDTFNPKLGLEYAVTEKIKLRTGYMYRPTPAPEQTGVFNYIDGNTHIICTGAGYSFRDSDLDLHVQYQYMPDSEVTKDISGISVKYGGTLWNTGITWKVRF